MNEFMKLTIFLAISKFLQELFLNCIGRYIYEQQKASASEYPHVPNLTKIAKSRHAVI